MSLSFCCQCHSGIHIPLDLKQSEGARRPHPPMLEPICVEMRREAREQLVSFRSWVDLSWQKVPEEDAGPDAPSDYGG